MYRNVWKSAFIVTAAVSCLELVLLLRSHGKLLFIDNRQECHGPTAKPERTTTTLKVRPSANSGNTSTPLEDLRQYPCFPGTEKDSSLDGCVRVFNDTRELRKGECHVISYRTLGGATPMCTYDRTVDNVISGSLQSSGKWEGDLVRNVEQYLKDNPNMAFLDLGCNIGTYALAAAKLGHKVVAVDAMLENLRLLSRSLTLGGLRDRVTLVWNAVSDGYEEVTLKKYKKNVGGTAIVKFDGKDMKDSQYLVKTIRLDDLIPLLDEKTPLLLKMDIETKELSTLLGGARFLEKFDMPVIQMEFGPHTKNDRGQQIIDILSSRGLNAFRDIRMARPLNVSAYSEWPAEVYFIRKT